MRLTQGIHRAARLTPSRFALRSQQRDVTWLEFADRIARFAGGLQRLGVSAGDRVAMLAANSDRYVEFYFATLWAGAVIVPVNTRWSIGEVADCLNDCGATVLWVDGHLIVDPDLR